MSYPQFIFDQYEGSKYSKNEKIEKHPNSFQNPHNMFQLNQKRHWMVWDDEGSSMKKWTKMAIWLAKLKYPYIIKSLNYLIN